MLGARTPLRLEPRGQKVSPHHHGSRKAHICCEGGPPEPVRGVVSAPVCSEKPLMFQPAPGYHTKRCSHQSADSPRAQTQKRSGEPNPQYFSKSTAVQMGGVLPYKWEAYCSTNGRRIAGFPFLRSLEARKVRRYKWGAYCRTNWRCTAVLLRQVVGVGVSKRLPINLAFLGEPMFCTLDSRGFRHFRAFRDFRKSSKQSTPLLVAV